MYHPWCINVKTWISYLCKTLLYNHTFMYLTNGLHDNMILNLKSQWTLNLNEDYKFECLIKLTIEVIELLKFKQPDHFMIKDIYCMDSSMVTQVCSTLYCFLKFQIMIIFNVTQFVTFCLEIVTLLEFNQVLTTFLRLLQ